MTEVKHILELMLNPFFILLLFLMGSVALLRNKTRLVRLILIFLCSLILFFSTGWIPKHLTERLEAAYPIIVRPNPKIKWVAVLGGGHFNAEGVPANNLLSGASVKRLVEGVRLFRQLPNAYLLLSGGGEIKHHTEAELLKQVSQWFSIPESKIVLEPNSLNTEEQAKALSSILGPERFYLVTSAIHMPRAMFLCRQQGLNPIAAPTDYTMVWHDRNKARMIIPNIYNFYYFTIALHELFGQKWAVLRG